MKPKYYFTLALSLLFSSSFAAIHHVTSSGSGTMDGTSWANAFQGNTLRDVINNANPGDQVWVACGVYYTTNGIDREIYFNMKNDVQIIGSFQGTETSLDERLLSCGPCSVLSGGIGDVEVDDNSYHVISNGPGINSSAILDGFMIEDANDNRTAGNDEGLGGGIYNNGAYTGNSCNPTIRNCVIRFNYAQFGAGIFNNGQSGGQSNPIVSNCVIENNHAYIGGGGIDNFGLGGDASPIFTNTIIYGNVAEYRAGAMYCWAGNDGLTSPKLVNCVVVNNQALDGGGIVSDQLNSSSGSSGNSNPDITNSIIWGNTASGEGPQFFILGDASFTANFSDVDLTNQNSPHEITSGSSNVNADPLFGNVSDIYGFDHCLGTEDDGLRLLGTSPCINTGSPDVAPLLDISGVGRIFNPDMGVYEFIPLESIEETVKSKTELFPNPAGDFVILKDIPETTTKAALLNSQGKTIQEFDVKGAQVDTSGLSQGVYFIQITSEKQHLLYKFVKE